VLPKLHSMPCPNIITPINKVVSRKRLDLDSRLHSLALLLSASIGLGTHDTTTPVSLGFLVLLRVTLLNGLKQLRQLSLVLGSNLSQSNDSGSLLVNERAESGLALDDGIRDTHLAAESWQEDDQLNGVNIVGDEDQSGLLVLNQTDDMVETVLGSIWLLADILLLLALLDGGGLLQQTLLLLGLALRAVLVEKLEGLGGGVAVKDVLELSNRGWDLETEVQDLLLALQTDVFGPLHHAGKVSAGLDVLTDTIVAGTLLDERVLPFVSKKSLTGRDKNLPWEPSLILHQLSTGGMGLEQPSFRLWEAIIEKRRYQRMCSLIIFFEL
jgi:hypothetical protein